MMMMMMMMMMISHAVLNRIDQVFFRTALLTSASTTMKTLDAALSHSAAANAPRLIVSERRRVIAEPAAWTTGTSPTSM